MLKLINFSLCKNILTFQVLIEDDETRIYKISVDVDSQMFTILESEVPDDYKIYERQARMTLAEYRKQHGDILVQDLPETITSSWV